MKEKIGSTFFDPALERYALGLDEDGDRELEFEEFNGIFPQGYIPWIFGKSNENNIAFEWLAMCEQVDGSLSCHSEDPKYSASVAVYALAASSLQHPSPTKALDWLIAHTYDSEDGGIRDTIASDSEKFSNVAGFVVTSFLRFPTFIDERSTVYLPLVLKSDPALDR